ncbi:hypothetical protein LZ554_004960 [Drepanopeziza brunnea f. sp. 'monogermtubi']|nr:hypothetical protein LZ554_004960 [Drepanopeziza brunnea f. sp. 'monogermtubi']
MLPVSLIYIIMAFTAPTVAVVTPTNSERDFENLKVGTPFSITWSGATGDVTISLLLSSGTKIVTIASSQTGNSFVWTPPALSTTETYVLRFVDSTGEESSSDTFDVNDVNGDGTQEGPRVAPSSQIPSTISSAPITTPDAQISSSSAPPAAQPTMITSPSASRATAPTSIPSSTSTPVPSPTSSSGKKGLSAGVIAGISVGAVAGVLLIVGLIVLAFCIGRHSALNGANGSPNPDEMEQAANQGGGPGWVKGLFDPGSTGSRNQLLKKNGDGRSSRLGTIMTDGTYTDGRSSKLDTMTFTDGRSSRMDTVDGRDSRMDGRVSQIDANGRVSRVSVHTDGRVSRIGRFEFEDQAADSRGFSGAANEQRPTTTGFALWRTDRSKTLGLTVVLFQVSKVRNVRIRLCAKVQYSIVSIQCLGN